MYFYTVGACYIMCQAAGAERVGGLEVKIRPRKGDDARLDTELTDWRTGEQLVDLPEMYVAATRDGIRSAADELGVDLSEWDITVRKFLYHPADSHARCYRQAAKSAFKAAMEGSNALR